MANMKRFGNISSGMRNRHGWRVQRQEARERILAPVKFIGGVLLLSAAILSIIIPGFLIPG